MDRRRRFVTGVVLCLLVGLTPLGASAFASAPKNAVGSAKWCANHPVKARSTPSCPTYTGNGGGGTGTGGTPPTMTVQVDPDPLVESGSPSPCQGDCCGNGCSVTAKFTGARHHIRNQPLITLDGSDVFAVVQVETSPSFAGDTVFIQSSQLQATCGGIIVFESIPKGDNLNHIAVVLDNEGNATVVVVGTDCAPGTSVIEADLEVAPFYTALTTLTASPPAVTPEGLTGYPTTSGTVTTGEVETGDTNASGQSDVYAVFYVETNPVYAEQPVEIGSAQLESRCLASWEWQSSNGGVLAGTSMTSTLIQGTVDDDGNAVFVFLGASCAPGPSQVIADVEAGTHPTYTAIFNIDPPAPTI